MKVKGKLFIQNNLEKGKREVQSKGGSIIKTACCEDCDGFKAYEIIFTMDKDTLDNLVKESWDWSYVN